VEDIITSPTEACQRLIRNNHFISPIRRSGI